MALVFTAIWLAAAHPLLGHFGDRIYGGGGDALGGIWWFWQQAEHSGYGVIGSTHVEMSGAPFGWFRGNAVNLQSVLVTYPAVLVAKVFDPVVAYNTMVLLGMVSSSLAMYWFVRWLKMPPAAALWAGVVFMFFPWHTIKATGHGNLIYLAGFPLLLAAGVHWCRRPSMRSALLLGGSLLILWLTSGYFGLMGLVALPCILVIGAIVQLRTSKPMCTFRSASMAASFCSIATLGPYALSRLGSSTINALESRDAAALSVYGARVHELFIPAGGNPVFGEWTRGYLNTRMHGSGEAENALYFGGLTIVFALVGVLVALRSWHRLSPAIRVALPLLGTVTLVALLFMLPSPLMIAGQPLKTPVYFIWQLAPEFRVPSRFIALMMAAILPIAAFGVTSAISVAISHCRRRLTRVAVVAVSAVALSFASFAELTTVPPGIFLDITEPQYVAVLRGAPSGLLAEYPMVDAAEVRDADYLFWQQAHGRPLVNGAPRGTVADGFRWAVANPTAPRTASSLATLGVAVVTLRAEEWPGAGGLLPARSELADGFSLLSRTPAGVSVWRVTAAPAPAVAAFADGFSQTELLAKPRASRWMTAPNAGRIVIFSPTGGIVNAQFTASSYGGLRSIRLNGRNGLTLGRADGGVRRFTVAVRLPKGLSEVRLSASPGPQLLPDGRSVSVYVSDWTFEAKPDTVRRVVDAVPLRKPQ